MEDGFLCPTVGSNGGSCVTICGDSKVRGNEGCDDGRNGNETDGCTDKCTVL